MKNITRCTIVSFVGAVLLCVAPPPVFAEGLTTSHTAYGVSQLLAGIHSGDLLYNYECPTYVDRWGYTRYWGQANVRLMNPTGATHMAAVIVYDRLHPEARDRFQICEPGETSLDCLLPERFVACSVERLTPHAAMSATPCIHPVTNPGYGLYSNRPLYTELISAPEEGVAGTGGTGVADGYGLIAFQGRTEMYLRALHPSLFTLPSDSVVAGQRQAAVECICSGLAELAAPLDVLSGFGVTCPAGGR